MKKTWNLEIIRLCGTRIGGEGEKVMHDSCKLIYSGEKWSTGLERNGMEMNENKKGMDVGCITEDLNINLKNVGNFEYLCVNFSTEDDQEVNIYKTILEPVLMYMGWNVGH